MTFVISNIRNYIQYFFFDKAFDIYREGKKTVAFLRKVMFNVYFLYVKFRLKVIL
jgi:hypothetical protein